MGIEDRHHVLHTRAQWTSNRDASALRNTNLLIPQIDRDTHEAIHAGCPSIPLLGYHALSNVLSTFEVGRNTMQTIDRLLQAIQEESKNPRAHRVEQDLCQLAIQAISLQRPFLRGNIREDWS